ncbi:MAG: hypothetical protein GY953_22315, partial [bacterium]|nr:hypothetical protein [bacterium]
MRFPLLVAAVVAVSFTIVQGDAVHAASVAHSLLWGENGEAWDPIGRLPDFSFAGYNRGERPLPTLDLDNAISVKQFGATGDGATDDTEAFLEAIESVDDGVIFVPPGRYRITDILEIRKSNLVIAGAGPGESVLVFPTPLNDIRPNWGSTTSGRPTSNYSWSGGFIWLRGSFGQARLASVTGAARRGDISLTVSSVENLRPGRQVEIYQKDNQDDSLAIHLYSGDAGNVGKLNSRTTASLVVTIQSVEGNTIHFDRPLRFDVNPRWTPQIRAFEPSVTEVGIENLGFEFPNKPYEGHFTELGANAIAFSKAAHCWVRNIRIVTPDSGLFISGRFNTIHGVVMESARRRDPGRRATGHHGLTFSGDDNLFTNFDYRTKFIHDITVTHSAGNVIANGRGEDLSFDHHKRAPYENLFTDIDAGAGLEVWRCGGGADLGKNCGARGTFWNIRARSPLRYPPSSFGPRSMNIVGLFSGQSPVTDFSGKWLEVFDSALAPANLYRAQLARRLAAVRGFT